MITTSAPFWWGLAWLLLTAAVFTIPLLPALVELRRRRDAHPIAIDSADSGDTDYRIKLLAPKLPVLSELQNAASWQADGRHVLPSGVHVPAARTDGGVKMLNGAAADILVAGQTLEMEGGAQVAHLAHAREIVSHGPVHLNGRTSADSLVVLAAGSHIFRVAAPCIVTAPLTSAPTAEDAAASTPLVNLPRRHSGDFVLEADEMLAESLVVTGDVFLRERARVIGHIKAHGDIELAQGASVAGSLFANDHIRCAGDNRIQGPVSAGKSVSLGAGTWAGSEAIPCSVSAWDVVLGPSVAVFGAVTSVGGCEVTG